MVDKKTQKQTQKQTVKQTVKVVIGDTVKRRPRRRVVKRAPAKAQVITFIQGSASGAYVPGSNTPYTASTKLPVASGTEVRTKALEIKGNNPALNTSGIISQEILPRLEKNSMASNEDIESVVRGVAKQKDRARRVGSDTDYYSSPLPTEIDSDGLPAYRPSMFLQMQKRREKRMKVKKPISGKVKKPLTIEDFSTEEEVIRPPKNFIPVSQRKKM
jgi:hypothetical protein